jgi:hypothetical protein
VLEGLDWIEKVEEEEGTDGSKMRFLAGRAAVLVNGRAKVDWAPRRRVGSGVERRRINGRIMALRIFYNPGALMVDDVAILP